MGTGAFGYTPLMSSSTRVSATVPDSIRDVNQKQQATYINTSGDEGPTDADMETNLQRVDCRVSD